MVGYTKIGTIKKIHGTDGKIIFHPDYPNNYSFEKTKSVLIKNNSEFIPFFITYSKISHNKIFLRFEDVNNPKEAHKLLNKEVWSIPLDTDIETKIDFQKSIHTIINFHVMDNNTLIGTVTNIYPLKNNPLIGVTKEQKEILIPYTEDIIKTIDIKNKIIISHIPDGLISI